MAEILKTPQEPQMRTAADAREAARKIIAQANLEDKKREEIISKTLNGLSGIGNVFAGTDELAALLNLPDEHFMMLAPHFMAEIEKEFNETSNQLVLIQALNLAGVKLEDLEEEYRQLCENMDENLLGLISSPKVDFLKKLFSLTYNAAFLAQNIAKRKMLVPFEICREGAKMPQYAHLSDAGMDVYITEDVTINPGETKVIPIGIKCAVPLGYELQVRPRSGRSLNSKLRIANTPGTIDPDYRDEIGIIVDNIDQVIRSAKMGEDGRLYDVEWGSAITLTKGEKIAQLVLNEVPKAILYEVDDLAVFGSSRQGGFGSTGDK